MDKKTQIGIGIGSLAAVAALGFLFLTSTGERANTVTSTDASVDSHRGTSTAPASKTISAPSARTNLALKAKAAAANKRSRVKPAKPEWVRNPDLSDAENELMEKLEDAMQNERTDGLSALAEKALNSSSPDVRERAIRVLGWFGPAAMAELTPFLADRDENLACEAKAQWFQALYDIEDERTKAEMILLTLHNLRDKKFAAELADEIRSLDRKLALEVIESVWNDGTECSRAEAERIYDELTPDDEKQ